MNAKINHIDKVHHIPCLAYQKKNKLEYLVANPVVHLIKNSLLKKCTTHLKSRLLDLHTIDISSVGGVHLIIISYQLILDTKVSILFCLIAF